MNYQKPRVIAEIGCNHKGDLEIAKELIRVAKIFCNADVVKFQKRNNRNLLTEEQYKAPHPNPANSYGETYGEHREFLEFSLEQNKVLKQYAEELGIVWSTSTWDLDSAKEIASLKPDLIKIPSACNNNYEMLGWLCENYVGEIHVSSGMTSKDEIDILIRFFEEKGRNRDVVLYACTSGYPVPFEDVALLEITRLIDSYKGRVKEIGFSGHHLGIAVDIAAYTLGATWIERHYTLDRTWKGTDHAASLEPEGVRRLVRNLSAVHKSLTFKKEDILDIEKVQREKLKYRAK
ncbi:N-acetylneuraminate synthase [Saccharicrinis carchari]|uniref:N-acetylneuraminate synthase n=1 Tax=Saccharicrinis carchari TaxID=1168039 RepID=A0A521EVK8_SACCC|nr:N-acetylneuraminate synthase family protein [Saccharicrinis carchari]SMO87953.1 N-acetylneuraminate synthase [Saccharicrinis carchari]